LNLENLDNGDTVDNNRSTESGKRRDIGSGKDKGKSFGWKEINAIGRRQWENQMSLILSLLRSM
jgi:hypothetical protein